MAAPHNPNGRERRKFNALKGGLSIPHILPCTESCFYQEICPVFQMLVDGFKQQTFVSTCAVEAAQYLRFKEYYSSPMYEELDESDIDRLIMLELRIERIRRYISLNPDLITPDKQLSNAYVLHARLRKQLIEMLRQMLMHISSTQHSPEGNRKT